MAGIDTKATKATVVQAGATWMVVLGDGPNGQRFYCATESMARQLALVFAKSSPVRAVV